MKVICIGNVGLRVVNHLIELKLEDVEFLTVHTDPVRLQGSYAPVKILLGEEKIRGLGTGGNPKYGRQFALESNETISDVVTDSQVLVLITGLGGGTGTGAMPVIAECARRASVLTLALVTKPFWFEGKERVRVYQEGLHVLHDNAHTVLVFNHDKIRKSLPIGSTLSNVLEKTDELIAHCVETLHAITNLSDCTEVDLLKLRTVLDAIIEQ